uniref:Uncharacterized protein n=1 Tax=Medicago truncatula TaxID=3880 RepID=I3T6A5_MEDTR|nr:unknown [Medicago truncatula]
MEFIWYYCSTTAGNCFNIPCFVSSQPHSSTIKSSVQCSCPAPVCSISP